MQMSALAKGFCYNVAGLGRVRLYEDGDDDDDDDEKGEGRGGERKRQAAPRGGTWWPKVGMAMETLGDDGDRG